MKINISRSIVAGMAAMFLVLGLSCSGSGADADTDMLDTATYTATSDTLSDLYGRVVGQSLKNELTTYIKEYNDTAYSIADFVDGLEAVAGHRRPMVYISGQTLGMRIESGDLMSLDNSVVKIDRAKVMAALKTAMNTDSIGMFDQQVTSAAFETAMNRFAADTTSAAAADTLAEAYGKMIGLSLAAELNTRGNVTAKEKNDFVAGLESVVGGDHSPEFYAGMSSGFNMVQNLASIEAKGVNVRREVVVDRIREAFDNRPLPEAERTALEKQLNDLQKSIFDQWEQREEERLAKSPEAIQNVKTGEALVAKMKKATPKLKQQPRD